MDRCHNCNYHSSLGCFPCETDCPLRTVKFGDKFHEELEPIYCGINVLPRFFDKAEDDAAAIETARGLIVVSKLWHKNPLVGPLGFLKSLDDEINKMAVPVPTRDEIKSFLCKWETQEIPVPRDKENEEAEKAAEKVFRGKDYCPTQCLYHKAVSEYCSPNCRMRKIFPQSSSPKAFCLVFEHFGCDVIPERVRRARAVNAQCLVQDVVDSSIWEASFWKRHKRWGGPLIPLSYKFKMMLVAEERAGTPDSASEEEGFHSDSRGSAEEAERKHALARDTAAAAERKHALARDTAAEAEREHALARDMAAQEEWEHARARDNAAAKEREHARARDNAAAEVRRHAEARDIAAAEVRRYDREEAEKRAKAARDREAKKRAQEEARKRDEEAKKHAKAAREREARKRAEEDARATGDRRTEFGETIDEKIKRWSEHEEGKLRNLLSTLQVVLWPECPWLTVCLTEKSSRAEVKKAYVKALLLLHPDKLQQKGVTPEQEIIAAKVFHIIKEAWEKLD